MLIIGHRGSASAGKRNTIDALAAGRDAGADMLEFDVRLTADNVPILAHDPWIGGKMIRFNTLNGLRQKTQITTLEEVLVEFLGAIPLNIELKRIHDSAIVYQTIANHIDDTHTWDDILISSFHVRYLKYFRQQSTDVRLALLHAFNPFRYRMVHPTLHLYAAGWHWLNANSNILRRAQRDTLLTYVYTVNNPQTVKNKPHIDAVVTDYPKRFK